MHINIETSWRWAEQLLDSDLPKYLHLIRTIGGLSYLPNHEQDRHLFQLYGLVCYGNQFGVKEP